MSPEAAARQKIDALLVAAGWAVQDYKAFNPSAASGIALREVPLTSGRCDCLLLVGRILLGVIEAKKQGTTLSTVCEQSAHYRETLPDFLAVLLPGTKVIPFAYESTGVETFFRNERDPEPRSRRVFAFHQPATRAACLAEPNTLRARLAPMPAPHPLPTQNLRKCQVEAITSRDGGDTSIRHCGSTARLTSASHRRSEAAPERSGGTGNGRKRQPPARHPPP